MTARKDGNFINRIFMKEYRIELKVKNNLIMKRIEQLGFESIPKFCEFYKISYTRLINTINMTQSPLNRNGEFTKLVTQLEEIFGCSGDDLFTLQLAECCCEQKMLIAEKACQTDALIRQLDGDRIKDERDKLREELIALPLRSGLLPPLVPAVSI